MRHEDVIADIGRELDCSTDRFPTRRSPRTPVDIASPVGPGWNSVGPGERERYTTTQAPTTSSPALLAARLNRELMGTLGYSGEK